MQLLRNSNATT